MTPSRCRLVCRPQVDINVVNFWWQGREREKDVEDVGDSMPDEDCVVLC